MKSCRVFLVALGLLACGTACQENWQSFFVHDNKLLGDPPECTIPTDPGAEGLLGGLLDLSVGTRYVGYLFVENGLIPRKCPGTPRAESNGIFVQGAYLYFEPDPACPETRDLPDMETRFSSLIEPQGHAVLGVELVPSPIATRLRGIIDRCPGGVAEIIVNVELFGVTQGGIEMRTQAFAYPVRLCRGCLIFCPTGVDLDPATPGCQCNCNADVELVPRPCHPGQDFGIDCRYVFCGA